MGSYLVGLACTTSDFDLFCVPPDELKPVRGWSLGDELAAKGAGEQGWNKSSKRRRVAVTSSEPFLRTDSQTANSVGGCASTSLVPAGRELCQLDEDLPQWFLSPRPLHNGSPALRFPYVPWLKCPRMPQPAATCASQSRG
jgi:hypothetical protein